MKLITGNLFTSQCQTLVNTINCAGVMGGGVALEFKFRYPAMYEKYVTLCHEKSVDIGKLWLYRATKDKWILNFPTKKHWKLPSRVDYLEKGLTKFINTYQDEGITSIAFPVLGASKGGIDEGLSIELMQTYLKKCKIPVEIYKYSPTSTDDLYLKFRDLFLAHDDKYLSNQIKLKINLIKKIRNGISETEIRSISQLASVKGIGMVSLEKSFHYLMSETDNFSKSEQQSLFPKFDSDSG